MPLFRNENTLLTEQSPFSNANIRYITYAIIALLLSVVHVLLIRFIAVAAVTPDLLLILCVWIAVYEGQMTGLLAAFGAGVIFDFVSADVPGTNALAKILAVFIAGYFYKENRQKKILGSYQFLVIIVTCAFIHNLVYFFFYLQPMEMSFWKFFIRYGVATTLYTTVIASIPMLIMARKSEF